MLVKLILMAVLVAMACVMVTYAETRYGYGGYRGNRGGYYGGGYYGGRGYYGGNYGGGDWRGTHEGGIP